MFIKYLIALRWFVDLLEFDFITFREFVLFVTARWTPGLIRYPSGLLMPELPKMMGQKYHHHDYGEL